MMRNRLCKLLGIQYPIIQAPMNWITGADLVAAVSNAGGLGTLGPNAGADTITSDVTETGERLRSQIRKVKSLTDKPFAVNFPIGMEDMEGEGGRKFSRRCIEVALEEGIPVAVTSMGPPNVYTRVLQDAGVKVIHAVSTPGHAKKAREKGVDAVVCEGYEGGGHQALTGLTTMAMIPMAADWVDIPVIAAGGIVDSRGMVAALALGADGVYLGTRFIATHESDAHPKMKEAVIRGGDICTVSLNKWIIAARDLTNSFTRTFSEMQQKGASPQEIGQFLAEHTLHRGLVQGDIDEGELPCGQGAGIISGLKSASEVVENLVSEISPVMDGLAQKLPSA